MGGWTGELWPQQTAHGLTPECTKCGKVEGDCCCYGKAKGQTVKELVYEYESLYEGHCENEFCGRLLAAKSEIRRCQYCGKKGCDECIGEMCMDCRREWWDLTRS